MIFEIYLFLQFLHCVVQYIAQNMYACKKKTPKNSMMKKLYFMYNV